MPLVTVNLSEATVADLDAERGDTPRGLWIRRTLEEAFKAAKEMRARDAARDALTSPARLRGHEISEAAKTALAKL